MVGFRKLSILYIVMIVILTSCKHKVEHPNPWGETTSDEVAVDTAFSLDDIISNGEMIMVTVSGPETYYEYHGRGMGLHYLLCEKFCQSLGVSLRVDVCKDTLDMVQRIENGEADVMAMPMKDSIDGLTQCGEKASSKKWHWLVNKSNTKLAEAIDNWLTADKIKKVNEEQSYWLSSRSITRHVYSPMLNRSAGIISNYDHLFQRYAPVAQWDWKLLAAQCYQESTFDPNARSWAGAGGLMQIMPGTADELGLPRSEIYNPESNVSAATRYIAQLTKRFSDVPTPSERIKFVLASYNGGAHHVRDAMALAKKNGQSPYAWGNVRGYILKLSQPEFYNDPVVKYGYMRGSETADYVDRIWSRWFDYRGMKFSGKNVPSASSSSSSSAASSASGMSPQPHPSAHRKAKYNI